VPRTDRMAESAGQDIGRTEGQEDVDKPGFEAFLELDDDTGLAVFDTAGWAVAGRRWEGNQADRVGSEVDILGNEDNLVAGDRAEMLEECSAGPVVEVDLLVLEHFPVERDLPVAEQH
jgi:hypothetical protein